MQPIMLDQFISIPANFDTHLDLYVQTDVLQAARLCTGHLG